MLRLDRWSNLRLRTKGLIVVAFPAAATVTIACTLYVLGVRTAAEEESVRHSFRVNQEIQRLRTSETEASSEVRAYFITADESFAGKARDTIAAFDTARQKLADLIAYDTAQTQRLSRIEALQRSRVERIFGAIARFRSGVLPLGELRAAMRAGKTERLQMEGVLGAMEDEEKRLLESRFRRVDTLRGQLNAGTAACVFFGVIGGVVISLLFASGITNRVGKLQENVSKLATGGVLDPLPGGRDEIGVLSEGMARTARILKHRTAALENALHGIAQADAEGRCVTFNRAYAELAGLPESPATASIGETVHPDDQANVEAAIQLMRASGRAETEARMLHADGRVADVTMTFIPVPEDRSEGYYVFLRDNRARKEAEGALVRAKDAAVASNAAKTGFLAKISHDIRTPLNAILGAADLLSQTPLSPDQSTYVSMFQRNCRQLVRLINDFLDFSRIEAGALQIQKAPSRIREIVDDVMATFRESAGRKNIPLGVEIDPSIPEWILVDPSRIQQVLVNLLSNAVKFILEGRVDVRVQRIGPDGKQIRFEVCDTGPGIAPADQERIFAPFAQLPDQKVSHRGSGLGLAICRELVELMGGEIGVLSRKGSGSTFHFDLPLEAAPATGTVPYNTASAVLRLDEAARILVAEDTADNRLLLEHYLREEPVELSFAADGREAVEASQSREFDLILMDIDMPGLDGYAASKLIRERQAEQGALPTPIVALSAHAMREAVRASLDAGCVAHIAKPIERSTLLRTIRRYALSRNVRPVRLPAAFAVAEGVASLVPAYLASKPGQIEEARASLAVKDFEPIQRFGHNLKGTGGGYGFPLIEELGKELESAAGARDEDRIAIQLEALYRFVTQVPDAIESQEPSECHTLVLQTKPSPLAPSCGDGGLSISA